MTRAPSSSECALAVTVTAGHRVVSIPASVVEDIQRHLDRYVDRAPDALVFTGDKGAPLRRNHWGSKWRETMEIVGMTGFRFHDLRTPGTRWRRRQAPARGN